ncbi:recombination regulator RecX [Pontibacillus litoralis]|uniref:Regulatory protein RecX n=1 Tax=Pontibacillus litoralis JSM 072002 TaxID=1385512 RepID=A0A0A5G7X3_9BACI|nr:recombination regulator RecX [Pontibacillus litoralis]KGX88129.1 recombinase RecX [Pontibacillus litoralis JSM 072002]
MPKITRITTQKRHQNRYNIFLDKGQGEVYGFSVDEEILIQHVLHKGMELDDSFIETLTKEDSFHKCYTLAIHYLSYRMRSKKEIVTYLAKKDVEEDKIDYVIHRLQKEGYLDDQAFADALVRTRIQTSSKGPLLVKKELKEKGVADCIAHQAIQQYTFDEQLQKATKWIDKKLRQDGRKSFKEQRQKVQHTLLQKGFTNDVIQEAMANLSEEKDEEAEWNAIVIQGEKALRKYRGKASGYELKYKVKGALYRKGFPFELIEQFMDAFLQEGE